MSKNKNLIYSKFKSTWHISENKRSRPEALLRAIEMLLIINLSKGESLGCEGYEKFVSITGLTYSDTFNFYEQYQILLEKLILFA